MVQTAGSTAGQGSFKRGDQVVCKPGIFAFASGAGEVKDVVLGNVVVFFESLGHAQVYFPGELDAYSAPAAYEDDDDAITHLRQNIASGYTVLPAESVPLATPVRLYNGEEAVVCGHSTCDSERYELVWFDRHFWQVRRRWLHRSRFEVIATQAKAAVA